MATNPRLGVSLTPGMLCGKPSDAVDQRMLSEYGGIGAMLQALFRLDVGCIEIHGIGPDLDADTVSRAAHTILAAGFGVSIHGVLVQQHAEGYITRHADAYRCILREQGDTPFVIHSLPDSMQTAQALHALKNALQPYPGLHLALENERVRRPACAHYRLSNVVRQAARLEIGVTWDMGHYAYNVGDIPGKQCTVPLLDQLRAVTHTHVHCLDAQMNPHQVLKPSPAGDYVAALKQVGYSGLYTLEMFSSAFPGDHSPREDLEQSICLLKTWL